MIQDSTSYCKAALGYAARGWPVLRAGPGSKAPVGNRWQDHATTDPNVIREWWPQGALHIWNLGVLLGKKSNLIDVECDSDEAERELAALLDGDYPVVPTFTGKRGNHRLFCWAADLPCPGKAVFHFGQVEFRTGNGDKAAQSIFPPSVHPDGPVYRWLVHPDDAEPVPFPSAALGKVREELGGPAGGNGKARKQEAPAGEKIREPGRNDALFSLAGTMRRKGMSREAIEAALLIENEQRCEPPLDEAEVREIARKICGYAPADPVRSGTAEKRTGYQVILDWFRETYQPTFRAGPLIHSAALGRKVGHTEACLAPGLELLELLESAADCPRSSSEGNPVNRQALPKFFKTWGPSAWRDLVASLPEEEDAAEIAGSAGMEFRRKVHDTLQSLATFGEVIGRDRETGRDITLTQRLRVIEWARKEAVAGTWRQVKSLLLWARKNDRGLIDLALRPGLFLQQGPHRGLAALSHRQFARRCELYDIGHGQKACGERVVELSAAFIAELYVEPRPPHVEAVDGRTWTEGPRAHTRENSALPSTEGQQET